MNADAVTRQMVSRRLRDLLAEVCTRESLEHLVRTSSSRTAVKDPPQLGESVQLQMAHMQRMMEQLQQQLAQQAQQPA